MACPVAYTTPKESYSKKAAFLSQSKATPDPRKNKNRKATKITADWLKNADVTEFVSQHGIADDIFSAGETHKSRQEASTLSSWVI